MQNFCLTFHLSNELGKDVGYEKGIAVKVTCFTDQTLLFDRVQAAKAEYIGFLLAQGKFVASVMSDYDLADGAGNNFIVWWEIDYRPDNDIKRCLRTEAGKDGYSYIVLQDEKWLRVKNDGLAVDPETGEEWLEVSLPQYVDDDNEEPAQEQASCSSLGWAKKVI